MPHDFGTSRALGIVAQTSIGYTEQGVETSPAAGGIAPGTHLQRHPPQSSLPHSVEARSSDLYTETGEGPSTALFLSAH